MAKISAIIGTKKHEIKVIVSMYNIFLRYTVVHIKHR